MQACPLAGCGTSGPRVVAPGQIFPGGYTTDGVLMLAADEDNVYWASWRAPVNPPDDLDIQIGFAAK